MINCCILYLYLGYIFHIGDIFFIIHDHLQYMDIDTNVNHAVNVRRIVIMKALQNDLDGAGSLRDVVEHAQEYDELPSPDINMVYIVALATDSLETEKENDLELIDDEDTVRVVDKESVESQLYWYDKTQSSN